MEACSPGVGNHSRRERTGNNPDIERKKQKRIFNRLIHELIIYCKKLKDIDMIDGKGIEKKNGGMYALDEIKISYAEAVQAGPIPSSLNEQKSNQTSPILNCRTGNKIDHKSNKLPERSPILNCRTKKMTDSKDNRIKDKVRVMTRFKPKWIIDLKLETSHTGSKDSGWEKAIMPSKPCKRKIKIKTDHVPKTIENLVVNGPKSNNEQLNPYNLRNR